MSLGCCASLVLLPMILAAQSFDCAKASTKTEKLICADPEIMKLDTQMAERYKLLLAKDAADKSGVVAAQARWLAETRNVAPLPAELKKTYVDRLGALDVAIHCATSEVTEWDEILHCAQVEFDNSDAELSALYRKLLAQPDMRSDAEAAKTLKDSQDAWLKFRDAQCEWETLDSRGGTLRPLQVSGCARVLTKERITQLTPK
jgi:uncharacterized protein YecT (DUF1311 family)